MTLDAFSELALGQNMYAALLRSLQCCPDPQLDLGEADKRKGRGRNSMEGRRGRVMEENGREGVVQFQKVVKRKPCIAEGLE